MSVKFAIKTTITQLTILTLCLFLVPTSFAKKGGGGKPPRPDEETSCATSVEKEPAIVYLTATEKTGSRKDFTYIGGSNAKHTVLCRVRGS
jgi:hypothetical protein